MKKLLLLGLCLGLFSCSNDIIDKNTPQSVFDAFWNTMNNRYVNFDVKHIDWDSVYSIYYPRVQQITSDTSLIPIFREIIYLLEDSHITINVNKYTNLSYPLDTAGGRVIPPSRIDGFDYKTF